MPGKKGGVPLLSTVTRRCRAGEIGRMPPVFLTSVTAFDAVLCAVSRCGPHLTIFFAASSGRTRSSTLILCRPSAAFSPNIRVTAASTRAALSRPSARPVRRKDRSCSRLSENRNTSQPFSMHSGTRLARAAQSPMPAIGVASDMIKPLKPRCPRNRSSFKSFDSEAGR